MVLNSALISKIYLGLFFLLAIGTGCEWDFFSTAHQSPIIPPSTQESNDDFSPNAKNAKANAELLHEMVQVVLMHEPKDRAEFGSLVDSLNQGASLEGIYNGLTHSSNYRLLEEDKNGASPDALRIFGEELVILKEELSDRKESFKPEEYSKKLVGVSIFTLKRILGDEALKVMALKSEYREKFALWYSKWVVHVASRNVDFGIGLRNKADEAFHYKWATEASPDRLRWEVLNRIHRVLNDANKQKQ